MPASSLKNEVWAIPPVPDNCHIFVMHLECNKGSEKSSEQTIVMVNLHCQLGF